MELESNTCKNCGHKTTLAYCGNCGQRSSVHKVTTRETLEDLADNLFSISSPLVITMKSLIVNPGRLFREYLGGKRKKYYKPISFFILTTAVYLFLRWSIGFDIRRETEIEKSAADQINTDLVSQAGYFMFENINSLAFFLVLSMSIALKLFFFKKYMFIEYVAIAFYLNGIYSLLATLNIFYIKFVNYQVQYLAILAMGVYFVYAMIRLFQTRPILVGFKSVIAYFTAYVGYLVMAFGLSYLIVLIRQ